MEYFLSPLVVLVVSHTISFLEVYRQTSPDTPQPHIRKVNTVTVYGEPEKIIKIFVNQ